MQQETRQEAGNSKTEKLRVPALDCLRGILVLLMLLVSSRSPWSQLRHSEWFSYHLADLVYPAFIFVMGLSFSLVPLKNDPEKNNQEGNAILSPALKRAVRLFMLGVLLTSLSESRLVFSLGTLQCLAVIFSMLSFCRELSKTKIILLSFSIFLSLSLVSAYFPGTPWAEGSTPHEFLDLLILSKPRGPEGVLSTLAYFPSALMGLLLGREAYRSGHKPPLILAAYSLAFLFSAWLLEALGVPLSPQIGTASFVLISSAYTALALCFLELISLATRVFKILEPLRLVGLNALTAYVFVKLSQLLIFDLLKWPATGLPLRESLREGINNCCGPVLSALSFPLLKVLLALAICQILYRRKIFIRL